MAMTEDMKEAIWLQEFLDNLGIDQDRLKINFDRMSIIYLAKNQVYHARTNHIDIRSHFAREILDEGDIEFQKIHMKENLTDMLTKVVPWVSLHIARSYSISFKMLELGGAHLMNYRWLDPLSRGA